MAFSECTDCHKFGCKYKPEKHYSCKIRSMEELRSRFSDKDIDELKRIKQKLEEVHNKEYTEECRATSENLQNVIDLYEDR